MSANSGITSLPEEAPAATAKHGDGAAVAAAAGIEAQGEAPSAVTVTVARPRTELYEFWRDFKNLPRFMENVVAVDVLDGGRSHWEVKAPAGQTVEWTSRITEDEPGTTIAWASEPDADVPNSGRIDFRDAPGGRGTWVTATIVYDPPAGLIGKVVAKLFQREPAIQARRDLRRFKQLMETGEVATGARNARLLEEGKN